MDFLSSAPVAVAEPGLSHHPLANATRECLQNLELCTSIPILQSPSWAEDRLADFRYWMASLGLLAPDKASLAYRLRTAEESGIPSALLQLLKLLNAHIELCISEASSIPIDQSAGQRFLPEVERTSRIETAANIEFAMKAVSSIQKQLTHLSVAFRRAASSPLMLKADRTFDPSQHADLRSHLTILIMVHRSPKRIEQIRERLSALISGSSQSTWKPRERLDTVQGRLVNANLRCRHRLVYAQRNASKLERQDRPLNVFHGNQPANKTIQLASKSPECDNLKPSESPGGRRKFCAPTKRNFDRQNRDQAPHSISTLKKKPFSDDSS